MFLHIGKNLTIPVNKIIAIVDKETSLYSYDTKMFIDIMKKKGNIYNSDQIDEKEIKTYIITDNNIYTSNISSSTLFKRNNKMKKSANHFI